MKKVNKSTCVKEEYFFLFAEGEKKKMWKTNRAGASSFTRKKRGWGTQISLIDATRAGGIHVRIPSQRLW